MTATTTTESVTLAVNEVAILTEAVRKLALQQDTKLKQALSYEKDPDEFEYEVSYTSADVRKQLKATLTVLRKTLGDKKPLAFKVYKEAGVTKKPATKKPAKKTAK